MTLSNHPLPGALHTAGSRPGARRAAVVVGRFQTATLHPGHRYLMEYARRQADLLIVAIGVSGASPDPRNPLDFETRAAMVQGLYPDATVVPVADHPSDTEWSKKLDAQLRKVAPGHEITLFGSRDSFLRCYDGELQTVEVPPIEAPSGTEVRAQFHAARDSEDFRAGVIYAATQQGHPTSFQTVDVAIGNEDGKSVLIGRKRNTDCWVFPGGFVDPSDASLEAAARRETAEEAGDIELDDLHYLGSIRVDDYRYRRTCHKILTAVFAAKLIFGGIRAGDDLEEVRWQNLGGLLGVIHPSHRPIAELYLQFAARA